MMISKERRGKRRKKRKGHLMSLILRHKRDPTGEKAIRRHRKKTYGSPPVDKIWRSASDRYARPLTSNVRNKRESIFKREHTIPKHHQAYSHRHRGGHREMPTKPGPGPGEYNSYKPRHGLGVTKFSAISHLKGSHLDAAFNQAKHVPGPGKYKIMPKPGPRNYARPSDSDVARFPPPPSSRAPAPGTYRPNTAYVETRVCGAPCLGTAKAPAEIDLILKRALTVPGPGHYLTNRTSLKTTGGALDSETNNTEIDIVLKHASKIPGPLEYAPEFFPKSEKDLFASLRRSMQKELSPNRRLLVHTLLVESGFRSAKI